MKKLLAGILATSMSLACFAACDGGNSSVVYDVSKGADALFAKYDAEEIDSPRREDFTLVNTIVGSDRLTYTVTWAVEGAADGVVTLTRGETETTVDVNETLDEDATYTLKATVSAPDGTSKVETFYCTVEAAPAKTPIAITAAPVEGTAYKLYMRQVTKELDLYFKGSMKGYFLATNDTSKDESYEVAIDVYAEAVVGKTGTYNLTFTDATNVKQYLGVKNVYSGGKWHDNAVYATSTTIATGETATYEWTYSTDYKTMIATLDGVKSGNSETAEGKTVSFFLGTDESYYTFGACPVEDITASDACIGYLVEMVSRSSLSPEYKVSDIKNTLKVQDTHKLDKTVELPTADERYPDATIAWAVTGEGATLSDGNQLALTIPTTAATVTLTATISVGATNDTKTFTLTLGPVVTAPDATSAAAVVNAAFSLAENETLPGGNYTLTGVISKVNYAYDEQYSNVTVTITVEEKEIECYRLKGTGADVIKAGDTITVTGKIKNYNGKVEFDSGCTLDSYTAGQGGSQGGSGEVGTLIASLDMMADTNFVSVTADQTKYEANGITYVNDKSSSTTANSNYTPSATSYAARAYQGSKITVSSTTAFKSIVFTLDDYQSGKYLIGFDGMEIAGATITRDNDVVTITFATAVTTFTSADLLKQVRIEKIEIFN